MRPFYPLLLVAAGTLAYLNSFSNTFFFDDHPGIVNNPLVRNLPACGQHFLTELRSATTLSLAVNRALGGLDVRGYHAVNLLLHLLAGLALYGLLRRLLLQPVAACFGSVAPELALATALLWLVHPLQTECVTYIVHRGEALAGLFYLLTLYCLLRGATGRRRGGWLLLAVLACAVGMKSKEIVVTAPVVALLLDRAFLATSWRETIGRRWLVHLGLAATWVLLSPALVAAFAREPTSVHEAAGAADGPSAGFGLRSITPLEYARSQPGVILYYLRLALWPDTLCVDYGWPVAHTLVSIVLPSLVLALLLLATGWAWIRRPALGFPGACFFLLLAPTSSIMPIADLAAERRMYLPLAPVLTLLVLGGHIGLEVLAHRRRLSAALLRRLQGGAVVGAALVLAVLTHYRNEDYRSEVVMWRDVTVKCPGNARGHNNLGLALAEQGKLDAAERCHLTALELNPRQPLAYNNLGRIWLARRRPDRAAECFARELEINPRSIDALNNLGSTLGMLKRYDEAIRSLNLALQLDGSRAQTHTNLGLTLLLQGKSEEAIAHLEEASRLDPADHRSAGLLGRALLAQGRAAEASECFRRAVALDPSEPRYRRDLERALQQAQADRPRKPL